MAGLRGVSTLRAPADERIGLVELRLLFKKAELRELEREATFAIERSRTGDALVVRERTLAGLAEAVFRTVAYNLTTAYGLHPSRALLMMIVAGVLLTPVYLVALAAPRTGRERLAGIYRIWPSDRIQVAAGGPQLTGSPQVERLRPGAPRSLAWAAYFSLLSACHIGFREINAGKWIASVQARDYDLRPAGWVRTVSGLQALLSLYLLAIWVLTYFGRPFG